MAKLTVTFKGLPLKSVELNPDETHIGRDSANDVHIDSLAIEEFHAVITLTGEGYRISPVEASCLLAVNHKPVTEALLHSGDEIQIGKHVLFFFDEDAPAALAKSAEKPKAAEPVRPLDGNLQVLNGKWIGMVIPLKATVTRIGKEPSGMVIVTREDTGYSIAIGSGEVLLIVNGKTVTRGEAASLNKGDMIRINNSLLQYFQEG